MGNQITLIGRFIMTTKCPAIKPIIIRLSIALTLPENKRIRVVENAQPF
jgi:hypothetical protein